MSKKNEEVPIETTENHVNNTQNNPQNNPQSDPQNNTQNKEEEEGTAQELRESEQQILQSLDILSKVKEHGHNLVSSVRVDGDHAEQERRINEEVKVEALQQKLQSEAISSAKRNAAVSMKWSALAKEQKIPQNLQKAIEQQIEACKKIIQSKDRLIQELQSELRRKDEEYVKALKKQSIDIDILIQRMHEYTDKLMKEHEKQLQEIEEAFIQERESLLNQHRKELKELHKKRRDLEKEYVERRMEMVKNNEEALDKLRERELEMYAIRKKELDASIHDLEQQIDSMRGLYQLNAERLEYNFQVLQERVAENRISITNNKAKLARLQDQLSGIKAKYHRDDKKYKQTNDEITKQYQRLAGQYKELINKFKYFEETDTKKFREIWKMNEDIVNDLAEKLLKADKIITEQQLGLQWTKPCDDFFKSPNLDYVESTLGKNSESDTASMVSSKQQVQHHDTETTKAILDVLCDSAGFLIEEKVKKACKELNPDESKLLKLDSILRAIGIENSDDVQRLISFFVKESEEYSKEEGSDQIPLVSPEHVIKVLKQFVDAQQKSNVSSNLKQKKTKISRAQRARDRRRAEERAFWERMSQVIPDSKFRVWIALEEALEKYKEILTNRAKLIEETELIRMQNNELRSLLQQYLQNKINEELLIAPQI